MASKLANDPSVTQVTDILDSDYSLVIDGGNGHIKKISGADLKAFLAVYANASKGPADTATNPGTPSTPVYYFASEVGTYEHFLSAAATPIEVDGTEQGIVTLLYNPTTHYWVKSIWTVSLAGYLSKVADLQNNFNAIVPGSKALDAAMGKTINDKININTLYGDFEVQTLTKTTGAILANTGANSAQPNWERATIDVTGVKRIRFTAVLNQNLGIAGYDADGNFLSTLDGTGTPIGNIYSNTRYAQETGTTVNNNRRLYTDKVVELPAGCATIKACSAVLHAVDDDPVSPLIISIEVFNEDSETVKERLQALSDLFGTPSLYVTKASDLQNSLATVTAGTKALDAAQGKVINDKITAGTVYGSYEEQSFTLISSNAISITTGAVSPQAAWKYAVFNVVPGQRVKFTAVISDTLGIAGYDADGNFLSTLDSYGLPIGNLYSNTRYAAITGTTLVTGRKTYVDAEFVVPQGCYIMKACSATNHSTGTDPISPLYVSLEVFTGTGQQIKEKVDSINNTLSTQVLDINSQLAGVEDITGVIASPEYVSTLDGTLKTSGNSYNHTDFIRVREVGEENKEIYILFTGIVTNASGLAGYDNSKVFLSTNDSYGLPIGDLWDYTRWNNAGKVPAATIATAGSTTAFTNLKVKIPQGCYYVRAQGSLSNSNLPGSSFPVSVKKFVKIPDLGVQVQELMENGGPNTIKTQYFSRIAGNVMAYAYTPITGAQPGLGKRFTFVHFSDTHYNDTDAVINHEELNDFVNTSECSPLIDAVLHTGDTNEGTGGRTKATSLGETTDFATRLLQSNKPVMWSPGNHDDNVQIDTTGRVGLANVTTRAITKAELYALFNGAIATKYGKLVTETNKLYSYQDFATYGIRVIALDRYEIPIVDNGGGTGVLRYTAQSQMGHWYSQAQLDWLQNVLSSTPEGYGVIVMVHGSLNNDMDFSTALQGWNFIPSIINAWKTGGTFVHSYTHPAFSDMNTSKTFDFTARGTGEFITYLAGHTHAPYYGWNNSFNDQRTIVIPCTKAEGAGHSYVANLWGLNRGENQETRNSFSIISVDRTAKKLFITYFGAHRDLYGNIQSQSIILNY